MQLYMSPHACTLPQCSCLPTGLSNRIGLWAPITAIFAFNWTIFILIIISVSLQRYKMKRMNPNSGRRKELFLMAIIFPILLGLGWIFGTVEIDKKNEVLHYFLKGAFLFFVTFQGLFIFLLQFFRNSEARKHWAKILCVHHWKMMGTSVWDSLRNSASAVSASSGNGQTAESNVTNGTIVLENVNVNI